jgi:hypothetical protein
MEQRLPIKKSIFGSGPSDIFTPTLGERTAASAQIAGEFPQ